MRRIAVTDVSEALAAARAAHERRDWPAAGEAFQTAARQAPLAADDLVAWADSAWWVGDID